MKNQLLATTAIMAISGSVVAVPVVLDLTTDLFGNETAFSIILSGGGSSIAYDSWSSPTHASPDANLDDGFVDFGDLMDETSYAFTWDLGAGDYEFTIIDEVGDGICCFWGDGSYALSVDGTNVGSGGEFVDSASIDFTIDAAPVPEPGTLLLVGLGLAGLAAGRRFVRA